MKTWITLLAGIIVINGCKSGSGGGGATVNPNPPPTIQPTCPGGVCFSEKALIEGAEGVSSDGSVVVVLSVQAAGPMPNLGYQPQPGYNQYPGYNQQPGYPQYQNPNQYPGANQFFDNKAIHTYFGPGIVQGQVQVHKPVQFWSCQIQPGQYQIQTEQPVQVGMATLQGGRLRLVQNQTGMTYVGWLANSQFYNIDGYGVRLDSPNNRIGLNMHLFGPRGESCGSIHTF